MICGRITIHLNFQLGLVGPGVMCMNVSPVWECLLTCCCFFLYGKMPVFDRPPLSFVDSNFLTNLEELRSGTARCPAESFSEFLDDGGCRDVVGEVANTPSILMKCVLPIERQNANEYSYDINPVFIAPN